MKRVVRRFLRFVLHRPALTVVKRHGHPTLYRVRPTVFGPRVDTTNRDRAVSILRRERA